MARNAHRNDDKKRRACRDDRPIDVDAVGSGAVADLTAIGFWPVRRQVRFPVTILIITALAFCRALSRVRERRRLADGPMDGQGGLRTTASGGLCSRAHQAGRKGVCRRNHVADVGAGTGKTQKAWLWAYARDDTPFGASSPPMVAYRFEDSRRGDCVARHLAGFAGILQVDGYAAYTQLAKAKAGSNEVMALAGCWAHLRRRFYELHINGSSQIATQTITTMAGLWKIEEEIRGCDAAVRLTARRDRSAAIVADLFKLWETELPRISGKSKLAEAIRYATSRREILGRFLLDGRIEIGRVDDWRGGCRSRGVAVVRRLSPNAGASFRTVAPFPVAARQTGRAELPHPAFSHPIRPSLSAGRSAGGECGRGRASHRDTRPGSGGTRRLVSQLGASTSGGVVDLCTS
jgi:hypothetical protein